MDLSQFGLDIDVPAPDAFSSNEPRSHEPENVYDPFVTSPAPVTQTPPQVAEQPTAPPASPNDMVWALAPIFVAPAAFVVTRLGATPLVGLPQLSIAWLVGVAAALALIGLALTRYLPRGAVEFALLLGVLTALGETLLLVAPVAALSAFTAVRVLNARP